MPKAVLDIFSQRATFVEDTRWRVLSTGLDRLADFGFPGLEDTLVELAVSEAEFVGHIIQSRLAQWIRESSPSRRDAVVERLTIEMQSMLPQRRNNALSAVTTIGYRDDKLCDLLVTWVQEASEMSERYSALWALVWLGYPETTFIVDQLGLMLNDFDGGIVPEHLLRCIRQLAPLALYDKVRQLFLNHGGDLASSPDVERQSVDFLYCLSALAQAHPSKINEIWDTILQSRVDLYGVLTLWSGIADEIDDPRIADYILDRVAPNDSIYSGNDNRINPHYHPYLKLIDLNLPKQLNGIHDSLKRATIAQRADVIKALQDDATVDTANRGPGQSALSMVKEKAWEVILRLNLHEARQWILEALEETGPFAASDICRLAGYLRVTEAVPKLRDWVIRENWDKEPSLHIGLGLAVLEALGNIGDGDAFAALLGSRVSFAGRRPNLPPEDTLPRNYSDALAAAILTLRDATPLIVCLENGPSIQNLFPWLGCAAALSDIASVDPDLLNKFATRLIVVASRTEVRQHRYYHFLINALGFLDVSDVAEQMIVELAQGDDPKLAKSAIEVLARWKILVRQESLMQRLGLTKLADGAWHPARPLDDNEAFVVGLLGESDSNVFESLAIDIILKGSDRETSQVVRFIPREIKSPQLTNALISRINADKNEYRSRVQLLFALARLAPYQFLQDYGAGSATSWNQSDRSAIVACCRYIAKLPDPQLRLWSTDTLTFYLRDSVFPISPHVFDPPMWMKIGNFLSRRSAARALAEIDVDRINKEANMLFTSSELRLRRFGVEASVWTDQRSADQIIALARTDREASVRLISGLSIGDRRRIILSTAYLETVLAAPADDIASTWHYGQALQSVGDDFVIERLKDAAHAPLCHPNRKAYLLNLGEEVEKNWKDYSKKRERRLEDF